MSRQIDLLILRFSISIRLEKAKILHLNFGYYLRLCAFWLGSTIYNRIFFALATRLSNSLLLTAAQITVVFAIAVANRGVIK